MANVPIFMKNVENPGNSNLYPSSKRLVRVLIKSYKNINLSLLGLKSEKGNYLQGVRHLEMYDLYLAMFL